MHEECRKESKCQGNAGLSRFDEGTLITGERATVTREQRLKQSEQMQRHHKVTGQWILTEAEAPYLVRLGTLAHPLHTALQIPETTNKSELHETLMSNYKGGRLFAVVAPPDASRGPNLPPFFPAARIRQGSAVTVGVANGSPMDQLFPSRTLL